MLLRSVGLASWSPYQPPSLRTISAALVPFLLSVPAALLLTYASLATVSTLAFVAVSLSVVAVAADVSSFLSCNALPAATGTDCCSVE